MTSFKEIFRCEEDNGRKLEVNSSHVSQRTSFIATTAGAAFISFYTHTLYSLAYPLTSHDNSGVEGETLSSSFIRDLIYEL